MTKPKLAGPCSLWSLAFLEVSSDGAAWRWWPNGLSRFAAPIHLSSVNSTAALNSSKRKWSRWKHSISNTLVMMVSRMPGRRRVRIVLVSRKCSRRKRQNPRLPHWKARANETGCKALAISTCGNNSTMLRKPSPCLHQTVLADAWLDEMRLNGSNIDNRAELITQLQNAKTGLEKSPPGTLTDQFPAR